MTRPGRKERATGRWQPLQEQGAIVKEWGGRYPVVLGYPNVYPVAMANLGFQAIYSLLNADDRVVAERFVLDPAAVPASPLRTLESGRLLPEARVIIFSVSFESDYLHVVRMLRQAGLEPLAADRGDSDPLVLAGGVATLINPLPLLPFVDAFLLGEGEVQIPPLLDCLREREGAEKKTTLAGLRALPGVMVPAFDCPVPDGIPEREVDIAVCGDLDAFVPRSTVTPAGAGRRTLVADYLLEINRGCPRGCHFCAAGFVYRPFRNRSLACLQAVMGEAVAAGYRHFGLVGSALGDFPALKDLCRWLLARRVAFSPASLRADCLDEELAALLRAGGARSLTIAPEAGSLRLRRLVNKTLTEEQMLTAARLAASQEIYQLKLYFLYGLPGEEASDLEALVALVGRLRREMLAARRSRQASVRLTVSINPFIPKPHTPMQWFPFAPLPDLRRRQSFLRRELGKIGNVRVEMESLTAAAWQAILSRGGPRTGLLLLRLAAAGPDRRRLRLLVRENLPLLAARVPGESLPWSFMRYPVTVDRLRTIQEKISEICGCP